MSAELLFLIGTLFTWGGAAMLIRALAQAVALRSEVGSGRQKLFNSMVRSVVIGAVLLAISRFVPMDMGREAPEGLWIPLVWLVLPFSGWVAVISLVMLVMRVIQTVAAINARERAARGRIAAVWGFAFLAGLAWLLLSKGQISVLRGGAQVSIWTLVVLLILAFGAMLAMAKANLNARQRGLTQRVAAHVALLAGAVVFGMPFAWLMVTSFKEERDMSMAEGIRWIPRVEQKHPFMDDAKPLAQFSYRGSSVQANIQELLPGDKLLVEIERPYGMRGRRLEVAESEIKRIPRLAPVVSVDREGQTVTGFVAQELDSGARLVEVLEPESMAGERFEASAGETEPVTKTGLRWDNYREAIEWMPMETYYGLTYLKNTLILVILSVIGTLLSCSFVAYGFSRLRFPGKEFLFGVMLATMMLPAAVTLLPTFLIFRGLGWIDTLLPLWVPTFFAGAFNVFLLRQFFRTIPMELEDAAKIDGCSYIQTYWRVMMPQIKPAMAAIAIWTFMGAWNNFMGPLIYLSSPEKIPIAYALHLFQGDRGGTLGLMMAFSVMAILPVLLLFFLAQRYFIEGVQLSGLGGR